MDAAHQLWIQYDCISKTVLIECGDHSHVLLDRFQNKDLAEDAARKFAIDNWGYSEPEQDTKH